MRKVVPMFLLLLGLSLTPATLHAQVNDECTYYCHSYDNCDTACEICDSYNPQANTCEHWAYSTCGEATYGECGGCAIVDTWEVDQEISRHRVGGYFCGVEYYWWGHNDSIFILNSKLMRHIVYGHQVCNGVSSTVIVSSYYFNDSCYEFIYPDCCDYISDPNCYAPPWDGYDSFDAYQECH